MSITAENTSKDLSNSVYDKALDEKPFRLAKNFSLISVVMIFAVVFTLAAIVSRQAEIIITKRVEDDTLRLMENLNHQMFNGFLTVANNQFGKISLREPIQQDLLLRAINITIQGFDVKRVLIYNTSGQVVFATDNTELLAPADDREAYNLAVSVYEPSSNNLWSPPGGRFSRIADLFRNNLSLPHMPQKQELESMAPKSHFQPPPFPEFSPFTNEDGKLIVPKNLESAYYAWLWEQAKKDLDKIYKDKLKNPPNMQEGSSAVEQELYFTPPQKEFDNNEAYMENLRSQSVFRYEGGSFLLFNFFPRGEFVLRLYKGMEDYNNKGLSGVLEINRDLTPEYRQIAKLQYFAISLAFVLALGLTVVLFWVVSRGEAIITKRNLERQALRERLDQAERLAGLGSMVATVAHEIRNPLGIIHSTADVLNRFLAKEPDRAKLAKAIVEEANRLSEVVTEFLDFARPPTPRLAPVLIEEILEEILAFLEVTLTRAGVEVRTDFRQDQSPVPGDAPMLHRAFLNILINAIQAMDDGGLISLSSYIDESNPKDLRLIVKISDTGPGLSEEAHSKMFSPFYTTKAKGTGLGLVIVRNIIEGHQGKISLENGPESADEDECGPGLSVIISLKMS